MLSLERRESSLSQNKVLAVRSAIPLTNWRPISCVFSNQTRNTAMSPRLAPRASAALVRASIAENTRRAYETALRRFEQSEYPETDGGIAAYLSSLYEQGRSAACAAMLAGCVKTPSERGNGPLNRHSRESGNPGGVEWGNGAWGRQTVDNTLGEREVLGFRHVGEPPGCRFLWAEEQGHTVSVPKASEMKSKGIKAHRSGDTRPRRANHGKPTY